MHYFKFTGRIFICDDSFNRIQPNIIDLQTGKLHKPAMTNKNKAFAKFWNNSQMRNEQEFYFTAYKLDDFSSVLRSVKIYPKDEFIENFAEYLI